MKTGCPARLLSSEIAALWRRMRLYCLGRFLCKCIGQQRVRYVNAAHFSFSFRRFSIVSLVLAAYLERTSARNVRDITRPHDFFVCRVKRRRKKEIDVTHTARAARSLKEITAPSKRTRKKRKRFFLYYAQRRPLRARWSLC